MRCASIPVLPFDKNIYSVVMPGQRNGLSRVFLTPALRTTQTQAIDTKEFSQQCHLLSFCSGMGLPYSYWQVGEFACDASLISPGYRSDVAHTPLPVNDTPHLV